MIGFSGHLELAGRTSLLCQKGAPLGSFFMAHSYFFGSRLGQMVCKPTFLFFRGNVKDRASSLRLQRVRQANHQYA